MVRGKPQNLTIGKLTACFNAQKLADNSLFIIDSGHDRQSSDADGRPYEIYVSNYRQA